MILSTSFCFLVVFILRANLITRNVNVKNSFSKNMNMEAEAEAICMISEVLSNGGFCTSKGNPFIGGNLNLDPHLCGGIENLVGKAAIGDFGAGMGQYGRCFLRNLSNARFTRLKDQMTFKNYLTEKLNSTDLLKKPQVIKTWEGYDGALRIENITGNWVRAIDLTKPFDLGKKFDWVMSLEVGEHIPQKFETTFLDNLIRHACKGIILSWAIPGKGGLSHVNNRPNKYIILLMKKRGWKHSLSDERFLRNSAGYDYFRNTLMVFKNNDFYC